MDENKKKVNGVYTQKPSVANLGIFLFYDALEAQGAECTQLHWTPPFQQDKETEELLDEFL